jgi:hypothetical protein
LTHDARIARLSPFIRCRVERLLLREIASSSDNAAGDFALSKRDEVDESRSAAIGGAFIAVFVLVLTLGLLQSRSNDALLVDAAAGIWAAWLESKYHVRKPQDTLSKRVDGDSPASLDATSRKIHAPEHHEPPIPL